MVKELFFNAFAFRPRPPVNQILHTVVNSDGDHLRELLATKSSQELTAEDIQTKIEGNLWMLTPEAFRYFLPSFLYYCLESYNTLSVFASEFIGALTEPLRMDIESAFKRIKQIPPTFRLPDETIELLRKQQLEWYDSGSPFNVFHERFDSLNPAEGLAVLTFFDYFKKAYGVDFPFGELEAAVDRYWFRYRN